jgi:hypothetical protein
VQKKIDRFAVFFLGQRAQGQKGQVLCPRSRQNNTEADVAVAVVRVAVAAAGSTEEPRAAVPRLPTQHIVLTIIFTYTVFFFAVILTFIF